MTEEMLRALREKHPDKALRLIRGDYFACDFGREAFDAVVSFESLHHFPRAQKLGLYRRIFAALRPGGAFCNGDYMVETEEEEEALAREAARLRAEARVPEGVFVHLDTPLAIAAEEALLRQAGFANVERLLREGNTTLLRAERD